MLLYRLPIYSAVISVLLMSAAIAQDAGRYTMRQTDDGFIRLDTQTGTISVCTPQGSDWSCTGMKDDSRDLSSQVDELRTENTTLRAENERLKAELEGQADDPTSSSRVLRIPDDKDIDRAFSFLDRMIQKFKDLVEDLNEKEAGGTQL